MLSNKSRRNKRKLGLNMEIKPEPFCKEHLLLPHDFIKCDVEGHESIILQFLNEGGELKPCVLEAHSKQLKEQFESLWPLTQGRRLVKSRYFLKEKESMIEIDVYGGKNSGLVVAEVEFENERENWSERRDSNPHSH
jgi:hypothetical protein